MIKYKRLSGTKRFIFILPIAEGKRSISQIHNELGIKAYLLTDWLRKFEQGGIQ